MKKFRNPLQRFTKTGKEVESHDSTPLTDSDANRLIDAHQYTDEVERIAKDLPVGGRKGVEGSGGRVVYKKQCPICGEVFITCCPTKYWCDNCKEAVKCFKYDLEFERYGIPLRCKSAYIQKNGLNITDEKLMYFKADLLRHDREKFERMQAVLELAKEISTPPEITKRLKDLEVLVKAQQGAIFKWEEAFKQILNIVVNLINGLPNGSVKKFLSDLNDQEGEFLYAKEPSSLLRICKNCGTEFKGSSDFCKESCKDEFIKREGSK